MQGQTTQSLHDLADRAVQAGQLDDALAYAAELVRLRGHDHEARVKLALCLALVGQQADAVEALRLTAELLSDAGFLLPAIEVVKNALQVGGELSALEPTLVKLHAQFASCLPYGRPRLPPPRLSTDRNPNDPNSLLELRGPALRARAVALSRELPDLAPAKTPAAMPLFGQLSPQNFAWLVSEVELLRRPAGAVVIQEGEPGDAMYFLLSGTVDLHSECMDGRGAILGPGSVFGELALVTDAPRSATITASGDIQMLRLSRALVERLAELQPGFAEEVASFARQRIMTNLARGAPFLRASPDSWALLSMFEHRFMASAELLLQEGAPVDGLYLVAQGLVEVSTLSESGARRVLATLRPGDTFGEISLLEDTPATADVRAVSAGVLFFLPRAEATGLVETRPELWDYLADLVEARQAHTASAARSSVLPISADGWIGL